MGYSTFSLNRIHHCTSTTMNISSVSIASSRHIFMRRPFKHFLSTASRPCLPQLSREKSTWIRKATPDEELFEVRHKNRGDGVNSFLVRLRSEEDINEKSLRTALKCIKRNIPHMRLCLDNKDGNNLWVKETEGDSIDFEISNALDIEKEFDDFMHTGFDGSKGLNWRVKFLPWKEEHRKFIDQCKVFYPPSNEKTEYEDNKKISYLMISFHHGLFDGFSAIFILRKLLQLLNVHNEDEVRFDELKSFDIRKKESVREQIKERLVSNSAFLAERALEAATSYQRPSLIDCYPMDISSKRPIKSGTFYGQLGEKVSKRFTYLCKQHGVSVHLGLTSMLNYVTALHMREAGDLSSSYKVTSAHSVNERPWHEGSNFDIGLCIGKMRFSCDVPRNLESESFWNFVEKSNKSFKEKLKHKPSYEEVVLRDMSAFSLDCEPLEHPEFMFPTIHHFNVSNVLDTTHFFPVSGKVTTDWFVGTNPCHSGTFMWQCILSSFRGRLTQILTYNNHLMEKQLAYSVFENLFHCVKNLTEEKELKLL